MSGEVHICVRNDANLVISNETPSYRDDDDEDGGGGGGGEEV